MADRPPADSHARAAAIRAWAALATDLPWVDPPAQVLAEGPGGTRWFPGGSMNAATWCLDRHLPDRGSSVAVHWEGEPGDRLDLTYDDLSGRVRALAAGLRGLGVRPGDRVALYMGWIPEMVVAMLACARLGAIHIVVPTPVPADALADRLADVGPRVVITQDGAWRHGVILPLKVRADEALEAVDGIEHTVVVRRTGNDVPWYEGDRWYHDLVDGPPAVDEPAPALPADHPLLVVHLSDRRGRPRAVQHGTAGLLVTTLAVHCHGLTAGDDDVLWCPVDPAWAAGQAHGVYGPMMAGGTTVLYEGTLDIPSHDRMWQIVERYGVTTLLAPPSVWRNLRDWAPPAPGRLRSLRYVVTAGAAADRATWDWMDRVVGGTGDAVIADAWGQTELGGAVLFRPPRGPGLPDLGLDVVDAGGRSVPIGVTGELVLRHPWPSLPEADPVVEERRRRVPGAYATSDQAKRRPDGEVAILGRMDPVMSVSGQIVSASEVRDVLLEHPLVAAAEAVERTEATGGEVVVACVVLRPGTTADAGIAADLRAGVREVLGGLATPHVVAFCPHLGEGVSRPVLRRALWRVVAGSLGGVLIIDAVALDAALVAASEEMA